MAAKKEVVFKRHDDGSCTVSHYGDEGDWWCRWSVADTEEAAMNHMMRAYYKAPGMSFVRRCSRLEHPRKFVFFQSGGLDI